MKNKFFNIKVGDKVNLKTFVCGKYKMIPSIVTSVYTDTFSINNGIMTYSKITGWATRGNEIITHFI